MIGDSSHFLLIFLRIKANVSKNQIFEWWCCVKTCLNLFFQINLMWIENQLQLLKSPAGWIWAFKGSAELCSKSYPSATTPYWDQTLQLISRSIETNWDQLRSIETNLFDPGELEPSGHLQVLLRHRRRILSFWRAGAAIPISNNRWIILF